VANLRAFLKAQALTRLPDSWLHALKGRHYERVLREFDEDDEPDLAIVRRLVARDTTAIDLGANIGVYTRALSELTGPRGRVVSVEPVADTFAILSRNVRTLRMTNVTLVNAAVSDKSEMVSMVVPSYESGGANFYKAQVVASEPDPTQTARHVRVRSMTLDEIVSACDRISFVKCDVEGHELKCLTGAASVIANHHPAWLIEVSGSPDVAGSSAASVFALLEGRGYRGWYFDGGLLHERRRGDRSTNYFFLTESHVSALRASAPAVFVQRA
jgi:FkbM family methyltransferase